MMETQTRRRRPEGERSHQAILDAATRLASVDGIHGVTLGRLADEIGVSKSGLYAHFESKLDLQLQTIQAAVAVFQRQVVRRGMEEPPGIGRLEGLCEAYLSYIERRVFPGGCFFVGLVAEADAQTGPVHDTIKVIITDWLKLLESVAREAQEVGQLDDDVDLEQLVFEVEALLDLANCFFILFDDPEHIRRARQGIRRILSMSGASPGLKG